ncbi:MAG: N-acetylmuramoyl-L-alanine amidase family protein [Thermodesulfobacteriota bacterium]
MKISGIVLPLLICCGVSSARIDHPRFHRKIAPIVIIDPGHGGYDTGSRGSAGTLEKEVTLALAQLLVAELKNRYQVILTRSDDYWLDLNSRAAEANYQGGDLFLSLHASAGFGFTVKDLTVSYYQTASGNEAHPPGDGEPPVDTNDPPTWENTQRAHYPESKSLGMALQESLGRIAGGAAVRLQGLPLAILAGVDMPAVILEIAYLTNPAEELKLIDERHAAALAQAIGQGIDAYFSKKR